MENVENQKYPVPLVVPRQRVVPLKDGLPRRPPVPLGDVHAEPPLVPEGSDGASRSGPTEPVREVGDDRDLEE